MTLPDFIVLSVFCYLLSVIRYLLYNIIFDCPKYFTVFNSETK